MYIPRIKESVNNLSRKNVESLYLVIVAIHFPKLKKNLLVGQQILNNSSKKYSASASNILQNQNHCN